MMAASRKMLDREPGEIEMLLPFHAAGTLNARDARRVEEALASDPDLARQYAVIREEYAETISLNESLGAPSARAMQKLFAAIDAEPVRKPSLSVSLSARISAGQMGVAKKAGRGVAEYLVGHFLIAVGAFTDGEIAALALFAFAANNGERHDNAVAFFEVFFATPI